MELQEREKLIRRISSAKLYGFVNFNNEDYKVIIKDPTVDLLSEADFLYDYSYKNFSQNKDIITIEESYKILIEQGIWSSDKDLEFQSLVAEVKGLRDQLPKLKFHKIQAKAIKLAITEKQNKILELDRIKNQLYSSTLEYLCSRVKKRFLMSKCTTVEKLELLENPIFQDTLAVYYFEDSSFKESQIRELARKDPFRLMWVMSKETGTPLFSCPTTHITDLQYALSSWSRIYDWAYSSDNRPAEDVIEDDEAFLSWYSEECQRLNEESTKRSTDNKYHGNEVFIPADSEGAKDVMALNDQNTRMKMKKRQESLEKHGELREHQLPDVKQEIQMQANRMLAEKR